MRLFFLCILSISLNACVDDTVPTKISGHYEGTLTTHLNNQFKQIPVHTDFSGADSFPSQIMAKDASNLEQITIQIFSPSQDKISVQSSLVISQTMELNRTEAACYSGKSNMEITLCLSYPELKFEIRSAEGAALLSLVLYPFKAEQALPQEKSQVFLLKDAMERARNMSFASRIEFEHVVQAKANMRAAYLHLLPQLSFGTIAGAVTGNITLSFSSLLNFIGDLAPFLLPTRWIMADLAKNMSKAEVDAQRLMRLDMGVEIEGMYYAYDRDRVARNFYGETLQKVTEFRNEIKIREDMGQLPTGSTDNMNSVLNQISQSYSVLNQVLAEDRAAISQALGFFNPLVVEDATIDGEQFPIDMAPSVDFPSLQVAAIGRSFELDQMDYLILAAQNAKEAKFFSWLDPAGDSNLGLGFALSPQIEMSNSQIQELQINRDQLKSILSQKAYNAVMDYQQALKAFVDANDGMNIQVRRLNQAKLNLETGTKVDLFGLVAIFQDYLNVEIQREAARANYRVARAHIDRLLLTGYYSKF